MNLLEYEGKVLPVVIFCYLIDNQERKAGQLKQDLEASFQGLVSMEQAPHFGEVL